MQITVESLSSVKKKISFEIPESRVSSEIDKVYVEIGRGAAIKGFRKGKVPKSLIEKHYSGMMEQDVVKNLVNDTYFKALADENINPVSYPVIENNQLKKGEPFRYTAVVEVFPEVVVKDFTGLHVRRELYQFDEAAIERRLGEMRDNFAQLKPAEEGHLSAQGDFVTFDFEGFKDGIPFENGKGEDHQLELGSGRFIPGFEEQMTGMKVGEEREVRVTFPENYGQEELAGQEATFVVKVKDIRIKDLPELDDDFVKQLGEVETVDHLKAKLRENYEKQEKDRIQLEFRENLVKALIARNDLEIPEALVDQQLDLMLGNAKKRLAYQRLTIEMMGLNDQSYKVQYREVAQMQVKGSLLLEALARQEDIKADECDLDEKLRQISGDSEQSIDTVKNYYLQNEKAKENLLAQIREDKVLEFLSSKADISEVSREQIHQ